jgi:hypothetical protein
MRPKRLYDLPSGSGRKTLSNNFEGVLQDRACVHLEPFAAKPDPVAPWGFQSAVPVPAR